MNRLFGFFILLFVIVFFVHGQGEITNFDREIQLLQEQPVKTADAKKNWISGEIIKLFNFYGVGVKYERMIINIFSFGANFYLQYRFIAGYGELGINAFFRYYPLKKSFFIGTALGFSSWTTSAGPGKRGYGLGMEVTPEIGWKIDLGNASGLFLSPGIKMPFIFGYRDDVGYEKTNFKPLNFEYPFFRFGIGYAF